MTKRGRPSDARVYHATISAEGSCPEDREVVLAFRAIDLDPAISMVENRAFLVRAVTYLAHEGVRQFLDIGAGLPAWGNVHEVAARFQQKPVVAYVDNDLEVVERWNELPQGVGRMGAVQADLRRPELILDDPEVRSLLDFDEPVGLLLGHVLHLVSDEYDPAGIVRTLVEHLAPGSFLVISHLTGESHPPEKVAETIRLGAEMGYLFTPRSRERILRFFDDLVLIEPGLVQAPLWRPGRPPTQPPTGWFLGGVARKP